jgi:serine-type D-Ala-D-Ala carboxypeptidase (penicillin-binding protein 5/6)
MPGPSRTGALLAALALAATCTGEHVGSSAAGPPPEPPSIQAAALYLIELKTGRVLLAKDAARRLPPASLTKIMTALVAMETAPPQQVVQIDRRALTHRSSLQLQAGEQFHLRDLVAAMLVTSANDACEAVALHVGGTTQGFVALMNGRAERLGLADTRFANPCGFDAPGHYSTAADLATLTEAALRTPDFAMIVRTVERSIATVDGRRQIMLHTTNDLLLDPDVTGVKTGFTAQAGRCLIASMFRDGHQLLLVGLNVADRWQQAAHLLRYGQAVLRSGRE